MGPKPKPRRWGSIRVSRPGEDGIRPGSSLSRTEQRILAQCISFRRLTRQLNIPQFFTLVPSLRFTQEQAKWAEQQLVKMGMVKLDNGTWRDSDA